MGVTSVVEIPQKYFGTDLNRTHILAQCLQFILHPTQQQSDDFASAAKRCAEDITPSRPHSAGSTVSRSGKGRRATRAANQSLRRSAHQQPRLLTPAPVATGRVMPRLADDLVIGDVLPPHIQAAATRP